MISFTGAAEQDNYITVPYISPSGVDAGRAYILFITSYREMPNELIMAYDIERDEFVQIELPEHSTSYASDYKGQGISGACFDASLFTLVTCRENKIIEWGHFDKWYNGDEIVSTLEFAAIAGQTLHAEKYWKSLWLSGESIDITPYVSVNGLPPSVPLTQDVSQDSFWDCHKKLTGYLLHLRLVKRGGAGGKTFCSGVTISFEEPEKPTRGRSYLASKTEFIQDMWAQGPILRYGVANTTDGVDETIPHGCTFRPIACFASLKRTGTLNSASVLEVLWDETNIYVDYTGWQTGDQLYWLAIVENASLPREGWSAAEMIFWRSQFRYLDLSRNPQAVMISRMAMGATKRIFDPNTGDTRLAVPLNSSNSVYTSNALEQAGYASFYSDNVSGLRLTCGSSTIGNADTQVAHTMGSTPSAVIITSHLNPGSAMGFVRGVDSTYLTLRHTSSGRLDWVAFL